MIKRMIKFLAKKVLSVEIEQLNKKLKAAEDLSFRLATRLKPFEPVMVEDGCTDNTPIIEFMIDVSLGLRENLKIPTGNYNVNNPIQVNKIT